VLSDGPSSFRRGPVSASVKKGIFLTLCHSNFPTLVPHSFLLFSLPTLLFFPGRFQMTFSYLSFLPPFSSSRSQRIIFVFYFGKPLGGPGISAGLFFHRVGGTHYFSEGFLFFSSGVWPNSFPKGSYSRSSFSPPNRVGKSCLSG